MQKENSPHRMGLNSVHLHLGHLPALSKGTGFVKCFMYWHALHFHRIECSSCERLICLNAFAAMSRIASRAAISVLGVESINSIPSAEVSELAYATYAPIAAVKQLSCSHEHIKPKIDCPEEKTLSIPLSPDRQKMRGGD
jgi:hypothetical protein